MPAAAALAAFNRLRDEAAALLFKAGELAILNKLGDLQIAQVKAARELADADFSRTPLSPAPDDFDALATDLRTIACAVDLLIEAVGLEVMANSNVVSKSDFASCFQDQLFGALDGNALYLIEQARERAVEDRLEYEADPKGWAKADRLGVS